MSKNLHDLSDDEFDDLFRESAEKADIGFDPDAWKKMSQKLDAASDLPSSSGKSGNLISKWGLPLVVLLLLLISGSYFFIRKPSEAITTPKVKTKESTLKQRDSAAQKYVSTDKVTTQNQENTVENTTKTDNSVIVNTTKSKVESKEINKTQAANKAILRKDLQSTSAEDAEQTDRKDDSKSASLNQKNNEIADANNTKETKESTDLRNTSRVRNTSIIKDKKTNESKSENLPDKTSKRADYTEQKLSEKTKTNLLSNNTPTDVDGIIPNNLSSVNTSAVDSANTIQPMQWESVVALSPIIPLFNSNLKLPVVSFESTFEQPIAKPRENTAFRRGLNIRLALSPDFSFIPSNEVLKIGNNWAAIVEYRFNNRLSIQTGVIRSLKLYNALPNQYEWTGYYNPSSPIIDIDATCKMLDIPLNIRYDLSQKPNSRWFVSTGFTSYVMLKEEYRYNYENPSDPNIKRTGWVGKTGTYPFGVLNLSTGYERQIFRRLTLQVEPFFKTPLGKVGYGKVRLATAGVFFSAKYPF